MRGYLCIFLVFFFVQNTPSLASICPEGWSGLLPDPEDCGKYYQCSNGYPYSFNCSGNLHFNPNLLVCDWPENAGCVLSSTSPSTQPSTTSSSSVSTEPPIITSTPNSTQPPTTSSSSAPTEPPTTTSTQPPTTSSPSVSSEPPATTSTPVSTQPPTSSSSETTEPPTTTPTPEETTPQETTPLPETTLYPETTPEEFYTTTLLPFESEGSGDQWDISRRSSLVRCPVNDNGADIFLPNPRDCNGFYYCSFGIAVPQHCPVGYHWSIQLGLCTSPVEAGCIF